jgi:hypothetical protein
MNDDPERKKETQIFPRDSWDIIGALCGITGLAILTALGILVCRGCQ